MTSSPLVLIFISSFFISCGFETGNPFHLSEENNNSSPIHSALYVLPTSSCDRLSQCFGWNLNDCQNELWANPGWGSFFSFNPATLNQISNAVYNQDLNLNTDSLASCSDEIINLSCEDEVLNRAVVDGEPNNQENIFQLFESINSCKDIISP